MAVRDDKLLVELNSKPGTFDGIFSSFSPFSLPLISLFLPPTLPPSPYRSPSIFILFIMLLLLMVVFPLLGVL